MKKYTIWTSSIKKIVKAKQITKNSTYWLN